MSIRGRLKSLEIKAAVLGLISEPEVLDIKVLSFDEQEELLALARHTEHAGGLEGLTDNELGRFALLLGCVRQWPRHRFNPRVIFLPCSLSRIEPWHHRGGKRPDISDWPDQTCHRSRRSCVGCPSARRAYEEFGWGDPLFSFKPTVTTQDDPP
jgi:hypothetical protein